MTSNLTVTDTAPISLSNRITASDITISGSDLNASNYGSLSYVGPFESVSQVAGNSDPPPCKSIMPEKFEDEKAEEDQESCKICFENKPSIFIVPCGHSQFCLA